MSAVAEPEGERSLNDTLATAIESIQNAVAEELKAFQATGVALAKIQSDKLAADDCQELKGLLKSIVGENRHEKNKEEATKIQEKLKEKKKSAKKAKLEPKQEKAQGKPAKPEKRPRLDEVPKSDEVTQLRKELQQMAARLLAVEELLVERLVADTTQHVEAH